MLLALAALCCASDVMLQERGSGAASVCATFQIEENGTA